jgi:hypothetical protein
MAETYNVYFGLASDELVLVATGISYLSIPMPIVLDYLTDYYWRVDAINEYGTTTGDIWKFTTIYDLPLITDQSVGQTIISGQSLSLFVTATGTPSPTYQWYKDNVEIDGETSSTLTIACVDSSDNGIYSCRATNAYGYDDSDSIVIVVDTSLVPQPFSDRELEIGCDFEMDVTCSVALDLLQLVPEKFRTSQILIDYLSEAGLYVGDWFTKARDIVKLLSPNTVSDISYLKHLGALIGVEFPPEDSSSDSEIRKNVTSAIDWYKVKGTYKSIQIVSLIQKFTVNLYDMYTNDYVNFTMVDWFVGDENENPPGLDASYYKSPHFGLEVLLNQIYEPDSSSGIDLHLWETGYLNNLILKVDETRPVHTVPHYLLLLNPKSDEFGNIIEVDGEIKTKVFGGWQKSIKYFDEVGSGNAWNFDDGSYFDESIEVFIKSITKWVIGTGNYPCVLSNPSWDVETPVLTGNIDPDDITITDEKITFEFIVPKVIVQSNVSELGLYIPGAPDTLVIGSCFPRIDKDSRIELRILVEIYRESLV